MEPRLFTAAKNVKAEEIKKYLPVNVNLSFSTFSPYLAQSENKYIAPLLGTELFNELVEYYNNPPEEQSEVDKFAILLQLCQFASTRLAYWIGYDVLSVQLSDTGASSKVGSENRLYRYQEENLKRSLKAEGFNELDTALEYCEINIDFFESFKKSPFFGEKTLVPTTTIFNKIFNINNSRLVFLKMQYFIKDVENLDARHRLGDEFMNELLDADLGESKYKSIIENIRHYIVYKSIAQGYSELKKTPTEKGVVFEEQSNDVEYMNNQLPESELIKTMVLFNEKAEKYLSSAIYFMNKNAADYPKFIDFVGVDAATDTVYRRDNTNKKIFVA